MVDIEQEPPSPEPFSRPILPPSPSPSPDQVCVFPLFLYWTGIFELHVLVCLSGPCRGRRYPISGV